MPQIPINDILPLTQTVATGGQTVYSTNWTANASSDVTVYSRAANTSANDATQILATNLYTVAFIGGSQTVQVTLINPSTLGDIVTITRQTPASFLNLYSNTNFTPSMLNNDFDIMTLVDQQAQLVNQRVAPRYNYSEELVNPLDLILPLLGANQTWAKNSGNTAFVPYTLPSSGLAPAGATYVTKADETATLANSFQLLGTANQIALTVGTNQLIVGIPNNPIMPGTAGMGIPSGTTAQRVVPSLNVNFRFNTDIGSFEFYYLGTWHLISDDSDGIINAGLTNELAYYAADGNTLSGLATGNNGVLVTSAGGVPSVSSTLPSAVQVNITKLGTQSQALNMNSHLINNVVDPVSAQDAATKNYVDQNALNGTSVYAASAGSLGTVLQAGAGVGATLTNAGVQATFALDGINPPVGSSVLIKNTATGMTAANEGIYIVTNAGSGATNWILTRASSYDTTTEINNTGLIVIQNGSTLVGTAWYNAATIVTVDTTNFSYSQFGNINFPVTLAQGGTGAALTASNGGIFYSTASAGAILAGTATAGLFLKSGSSTTPSWSTNQPITSVVKQLFVANGTYTPTTGMIECLVEMVGSGGGGAGAQGGSGSAGAGGGGSAGGYSRSLISAATIGASQTVTCPAGGAGGSGNANGSDGAAASLGALVIANGGKAGVNVNGAGQGLAAGGDGAAAGTGDLASGGGSGSFAYIAAAGALAQGGNGGGSFYGSGGRGATSGTDGRTAAAYGAGGGGAASSSGGGSQTGGAGAHAVIWITEFIAGG